MLFITSAVVSIVEYDFKGIISATARTLWFSEWGMQTCRSPRGRSTQSQENKHQFHFHLTPQEIKERNVCPLCSFTSTHSRGYAILYKESKTGGLVENISDILSHIIRIKISITNCYPNPTDV